MAILGIILAIASVVILLSTVFFFIFHDVMWATLVIFLGITVVYTTGFIYLIRGEVRKFLRRSSSTLRRVKKEIAYTRYRIAHAFWAIRVRYERLKDWITFQWNEKVSSSLSFVYSLRSFSFSRYLDKELLYGNVPYTRQEFLGYVRKGLIFFIGISTACLFWNFFPFGSVGLQAIADIRNRYYIPFQALPILLFCALLPFFLLFIKIADRRHAIEDNLPFLALLFAVGTLFKTTLSHIFRFINDNKHVWKKLDIEATEFLKRVKISGEQSAIKSYAETQPHDWLRTYLKDYASEAYAGGDLSRLVREKLKESQRVFLEKLKRHSGLSSFIITASLAFIVMFPIGLLTLILMLASMGHTALIVETINMMMTFIILYPILCVMAVAFKPHTSLSHGFPYVPIILSAVFSLVVITQIGASSAIGMYLLLIALSAPLGIYFMRIDHVNSIWLRDTRRFLLDIYSAVRLGRPIRMVIPKLPRKYSKRFNEFLDGFTSRAKSFGYRKAFDYATRYPPNEDARKIFSTLELVSSMGSEDPEIFSLFTDYHNELCYSIREHRRSMIFPTIVIVISAIGLLISMKLMIGSMVGLPIFKTVQLYLPIVFWIIPIVIFEGGYVGDTIATGSFLGGFRGGFWNILLAFLMALFLGLV